MEEPVQITDRYFAPANIQECRSRHVKMTDANYNNVLEWFNKCFDAGRILPADTRDEYMLEIVENIRQTTDDFFQLTNLPVRALSNLEKRISSSISQALGQPDLFTKLGRKCGPTTERSPVDTNCSLVLAKLYNRLMWAAIVSGILLLLLFLLLLTLCWLRNCMARELNENVGCCGLSKGMSGGECICAACHDDHYTEKKNREGSRNSESKIQNK